MIDRSLRRAVVPLAVFFGTFALSFVYAALSVVLAALGLACVPLARPRWATGREATR